jgi:hypothetical protein
MRIFLITSRNNFSSRSLGSIFQVSDATSLNQTRLYLTKLGFIRFENDLRKQALTLSHLPHLLPYAIYLLVLLSHLSFLIFGHRSKERHGSITVPNNFTAPWLPSNFSQSAWSHAWIPWGKVFC